MSLLKGLERIEAAREHITGHSFMLGLFDGKPDFTLLLPPDEPPEEKAAGLAYCQTIEQFLRNQVDPDEIERTAKIPDSIIQAMFDLGLFGMKIPVRYGGLGFSYTNYGRVLTLMASWSNILALTVAVPQSIGIAIPILMYGTEEQKQRYLPLVARKEISAFALTEPLTGSDAANVQTEAVLDATGGHFVVNGEKLWSTNGAIARYITLIARVPAQRAVRDGAPVWIPVANGKGAADLVHTAFVLDMTTLGVQIRQRCQFEGCRGIENAHMMFRNVKVPIDNVIGDVGQGLRYAFSILNVGRATSVPALCLGMAKQAWQPTLDRANSRLTFGKPLAERQTQRMRIGHMATTLFAMEALAGLAWRLADQQRYDIRIEAAIAKMYCSEQTIQFLKEAQILFGGMGYETADSKRARGEPAFGIEQLVRDAEMARIGEGATDILRPFVAREGLSPHLDRARRFFDVRVMGMARLKEAVKLLWFYFWWYLGQWRRHPLPTRREIQHAKVHGRLRYVERMSRKLARAILYVMFVHRAAFRDDQGRQNRLEVIGEDLLTIAATALYAESQDHVAGHSEVWELADEFFRTARHRIDENIRGLIRNDDRIPTAVGMHALQGQYPSLSSGIIRRGLEDYRPTDIRQHPSAKTAPERKPVRAA